MRTYKLFTFLIFVFTIQIYAQDEVRFKSYGQHSDLLDKHDLRYSLFVKGEYGISDKLTLRMHPIWIFMAPSIDIKWQWMKSYKNSISFIHGFSSPSPVMQLFAMKGTGGLISPEFKIPFMLSFRNSVISTWHLGKEQRVTGEFGVEFALFNSKLQPGSSIDLPIISPRNSVYYKNLGIEVAIGIEGKVFRRFDYYSQIQGFIFPAQTSRYENQYGQTGMYFGEATSMLFWNTSKKCKIGVGTKLCYGDYPFGNQWHLLPLLDFVRYSW